VSSPHRLPLLLLVVSFLSASHAFADSIVWFSPAAARNTGNGVLAPAPVPDAIRVTSPGGFGSGTLQIPLSVASDAVVDSVLLCYRTNFADPGGSSIPSVVLRITTIPTSSTTVLSSGVTRTSLVGTCDAIDVADLTLQGAPTLAIGYTLPQSGTWVEIGAVGLRLKTPVVSVIEPDAPDQERVALGRGRPNPFVAATSFEYVVPEAGPVELRVYDVAGRLVRSLFRGTVTPGAHTARWDGIDDQGRPAPSGVYMAKLETSRGMTSERLIRLH